MTIKIKITIKNITLDAELFDSPCAKAIAGALPIITEPNEWGDEFYFEIPVHMPPDDTATTSVKVGDIGYWPPAGKKDKDGKVASGEHCKSYVYNTTLCALMLEVYYRYLPSYKPPEDTLKDVTFEDKTQDIDVQIK